MRAIVINTKGGVGKSTTAVQLVTPYLYQKINDKIKLIEFDDENKDAETFDSDILDAIQEKVLSGGDLDKSLINNLISNDDIVIDVGGNKTTTIILDKLQETGMGNLIDIAFVPLTDGEQDAINAIKTYQRVKELNDSIKVIFVLSRVDSTMDTNLQFINFFGDVDNRIDGRNGLIDNVSDSDRNIVKLYNSDVIKYSRLFGITAYELAQRDVNQLRDKLKEYTKNKDTDKAKKVAYRITIVNRAKKYNDEVLQPAMQTISNTMEV